MGFRNLQYAQRSGRLLSLRPGQSRCFWLAKHCQLGRCRSEAQSESLSLRLLSPAVRRQHQAGRGSLD